MIAAKTDQICRQWEMKVTYLKQSYDIIRSNVSEEQLFRKSGWNMTLDCITAGT